MSIFLKLIYRLSAIPIKIPVVCFVNIDNLFQKSYENIKNLTKEPGMLQSMGSQRVEHNL